MSASLIELLSAVAALFDEGDGLLLAPLLLCLSGFIYYFWVYLRYRNTDKRHGHERETTTTIQNMQRYDQLAEHRKNLSNATMGDSNQDFIEGALSQSDIPKFIKNIGGAVGMFKDDK